jgi:hypothetical protein
MPKEIDLGNWRTLALDMAQERLFIASKRLKECKDKELRKQLEANKREAQRHVEWLKARLENRSAEGARSARHNH